MTHIQRVLLDAGTKAIATKVVVLVRATVCVLTLRCLLAQSLTYLRDKRFNGNYSLSSGKSSRGTLSNLIQVAGE